MKKDINKKECCKECGSPTYMSNGICVNCHSPAEVSKMCSQNDGQDCREDLEGNCYYCGKNMLEPAELNLCNKETCDGVEFPHKYHNAKTNEAVKLNLASQEECKFMILTPSPEHNGGMWCAEKYPCKNHGSWKDKDIKSAMQSKPQTIL
jgi:hypothetical protein